jgi:hypothetical protein
MPPRLLHVAMALAMAAGAFGHVDEDIAQHGSKSNDGEHTKQYPATYFTLKSHQVIIQAHITLMIISWVIMMPIGNHGPNFTRVQ